MKALIYKKLIDQKRAILFSSLLLIFLFYVGVENIFSGFLWVIFFQRSETKQENKYFRTLNFSKNQYFRASIIFSLMKLILRVVIMSVMAMLFVKTREQLIYFTSFIFTFFLLETAGDLTSIRFSGRAEEKPKEIFYQIIGFMLVFGSFIWLSMQFIWPMEKLVYGILYLSILVIIYSIYNYRKYSGVDYGKAHESLNNNLL